MTGIGAAVAVISNPVAGALSDRTAAGQPARRVPVLYLGVAVITTAGSVFVWKIRSVP